MFRLIALLSIAIFLGAGCIFTVEHEMQRELVVDSDDDIFDGARSGDSGDAEEEEDSEEGSGELKLEVEVFFGQRALQEGEALIISENELALFDYEISCEPEIDCSLECRLEGNELMGEWAECESAGEFEVVEEGLHVFEVRATMEEGEESLVVAQRIMLLFDFEISVQGLVTTTGVAHRQVGEVRVECWRADCALSCRWEQDGESQSFACPLDPQEGEELEIPAQFFMEDASIGLIIEGCATSLGESVEHCRQFVHSFQRTEPTWRQISAGDGFACGILNDQSLWCWGQNNRGQLGIGSNNSPELLPRKVSGRFKKIATGDNHACAIGADDKLYCWGNPEFGKLGLGTGSDNVRSPAQVGQMNWQEVAVGKVSSCAINERDELYCWGSNMYGQLGLGDQIERRAPEKVSHPIESTLGWAKVALGDEHTCAVDLEGNLYCWGSNGDKRLGLTYPLDSESFHISPQKVVGHVHSETRDVVQISLGKEFTCGVRDDKRSYCWGNPERGRLGHDGEQPGHPTTVVHTELMTVESRAAQSCGLTGDLTLYCWGDNMYGQLGLGEPTGASFEAFPRTVGEKFAAISLGPDFSCGIRPSGDLYCWGSGGKGALGSGTLDSAVDPMPVQWP